jgi:hypothetical protein
MNFRNPGGVGTGYKAQRQRSKNRKCREPGPDKASIVGKFLDGTAPGVKFQLGHGMGTLLGGGGDVPMGCCLWKCPSHVGGEAPQGQSVLLRSG